MCLSTIWKRIKSPTRKQPEVEDEEEISRFKPDVLQYVSEEFLTVNVLETRRRSPHIEMVSSRLTMLRWLH
jgi:hypothetical protein